MEYITIQTRYAVEFGVPQAIALHTITYFVLKNKNENRNKKNGKYWTFNSYKGWREAMPFYTEHQIRTALRSLRDKGAILTGNYNKMGYDKTYWYTLAPRLLQEAEASDYWRSRIKKAKSKAINATDKSAAPTDKFTSPIPNKYIEIEPY
jgi:hypothetical protein